ncbi:hypothetical protein IM816_17150 [Luteibacter flocculans]|uniref:Dermonecrotic toxin N-terminal domain-containing protein n=1 Tax=Luteibacter flocculans TaxID=2780091 RepID=A0ABY4T138_9GAMM|nr:DUF6543 domain-containing protein [Luteibacter flocculans]URL58295.1 hypothetical protein IM816_17150 [Luteibacter flocculans]
MDMLPPQAPPAHVSHANQAAIDMLQRMRDAQQWLTDQQDALWDLPRTVAGREAFFKGLDTFWETPVEHASGEPARSRRHALARYLGQVARDDAALRNNDGTLSDQAAAIVARLPYQGGALPDGLRARELLVGTTPYAGALVVEDDKQPGLALLFMPDNGWQVFESLDALYRDAGPLVIPRMEQDELPDTNVAAIETQLDIGTRNVGDVSGTQRDAQSTTVLDAIKARIEASFLDSRPITGEVFDTLARRLIARQRERASTVYDLALDDTHLQDSLPEAINLHQLLDTHAIVRHRDLALAAVRHQERLDKQPIKIRKHWQDAVLAFNDSIQEANELNVIPPIATFAEAELTKALKKRGIDIPAPALYVAHARRTITTMKTSLKGIRFPSETLSLIELAFRNISSLPTDGLTVVRADGTPRDDISADALREIVRDLDLPNAYAQHLDEALGSSPEGLLQRALASDVLKARMRFEAADARLSYFDADEPRSFMDDRLERGFQWVQAVLDHPDPAQRAKVERHEIVVHQLTYKGSPLTGVFMIAARQRKAVARVVLYTPDAPDGIAFREFDDWNDLNQRFILDRRFESYLLDRLPTEYTEVDDQGKRHFKTVKLNGRSVDWVLGTGNCLECTQIPENFQEREVTGSFLDAAYDTTIALAKRNAHHISRTSLRAQVDGWFDVVIGWNLPLNVAREVVVGTIQSIPNTANAAWRFYDHVKAGESIEALSAFATAYGSAVLLAHPFRSPRSIGGSYVRNAFQAKGFVHSGRTLMAPDAVFEKRFIAKGVSAPAGPAPASGVYTIGVDRFIHQGGKFYQVRFDSNINGWRLTYKGTPDSTFTGPAIERLPGGQWYYRRVGLLGGMDNVSMDQLTTLSTTLRNTATLAPELQPLSQYQRSVVLGKLLDQLGFDDALQVSRAMNVQPAAVYASHLHAWDVAVAAGRQAPLQNPRPVTLQPSSGSSSASTSSASQVPGPSRSVGSPIAGTQTQLWETIATRFHNAPVRGKGFYWPKTVYVFMSRRELAAAFKPPGLVIPQAQVNGQTMGVLAFRVPRSSHYLQAPYEVSRQPSVAQLGINTEAWVRIRLDPLGARVRQGGGTPPQLLLVPRSNNNTFVLRQQPLDGTTSAGAAASADMTLLPGEFTWGYTDLMSTSAPPTSGVSLPR